MRATIGFLFIAVWAATAAARAESRHSLVMRLLDPQVTVSAQQWARDVVGGTISPGLSPWEAARRLDAARLEPPAVAASAADGPATEEASLREAENALIAFHAERLRAEAYDALSVLTGDAEAARLAMEAHRRAEAHGCAALPRPSPLPEPASRRAARRAAETPTLTHAPLGRAPARRPWLVVAHLRGAATAELALVLLPMDAQEPQALPMEASASPERWEAEVPGDMMRPGPIEYWFEAQTGGRRVRLPEDHAAAFVVRAYSDHEGPKIFLQTLPPASAASVQGHHKVAVVVSDPGGIANVWIRYQPRGAAGGWETREIPPRRQGIWAPGLYTIDVPIDAEGLRYVVIAADFEGNVRFAPELDAAVPYVEVEGRAP